GFLEPARMRREEARRFRDVARAKTEQAFAEIGFGNFGELGPRRKPTWEGRGAWVEGRRGVKRRAVALGEQGQHLLDLHDLFCGAAEEAEERLAEGLAEDAQTGERHEATRQMWIAAPRQRVREAGEIAIGGEIRRERRRGARLGA